MLDRLVCGQQDGQHEVGGVAGGGQNALALAGLVDGALVALVGGVHLLHQTRLQQHHRQRLVQHLGQLLLQAAPVMQRCPASSDRMKGD